MEKMNKNNMYAEVVLRSRTGASLIADGTRCITADKLRLYQAEPDSPEEIKRKLEKVGFTVVATSQFGVSISGSEKLYQDFFKTKIIERPVTMFLGEGIEHQSNAFFLEEPPKIPNDVSGLAETLYIPKKGYFLAGEGTMPTPSYYHLRPPADISRLTGADNAHTRGFRGNGIKVAMVDSGFILNHDYYAGRGYNITVHTAVGSATQDEYGHGTGIAANLLAIAPACEFHFVKMSDGVQWATLAAFRMAVQAGARVITNSWGQSHDPVLEAEIIAAVAGGITVIFACGNGGTVGWPGCMPHVVSVGGAYQRQDGTWEASSYASSGVHYRYPNRHCPDLSAIVGHAPKGIFIVMPTMAGAIFDGSFAGGVFPNGDETGKSDGWLVGSGTSSAAPMVAGAAALLLQAKPSLTPAEIKQALSDTCIDVVQGTSASGEMAGIGPDSATGAGMINIGAAVDNVSPPITCPRAPTIICPRAPICKRAPIACARAPFCLRAPIDACVRAPIDVCARAPYVCARTPIITCTRAPIDGCLAGPWKKPVPIDKIIPPEGTRLEGEAASRRLVPVVVMVSEEVLEMWRAKEEAYNIIYKIGMVEEYTDFPGAEGCERGPFNPTGKE